MKTVGSYAVSAICALFLLTAVPQQARAQDFPSEPDWKVSLYLWTMAMDGELAIGPITADVDVSFSELISALDYGGQMAFRRDWGRNVLIFDLTYMSFSPDDVQAPLGGTVSTDLTLPMYQAYYGRKWAYHDGSFGWLVGARYLEMDVELNLVPNVPPDVRITRKASPDLTNFLVGGMFSQPIGEKWIFNLQADTSVGGSDSSWNFQALFQRKLKSGNLVTVGGRVMDVDFSDTLSNGELMVVDSRMTGLLFGFTWD
jgi:hypothetical protein